MSILEIKQSSNPDWIGLTLVTKHSGELRIAKVGLFSTKVLTTYSDSQVKNYKLLEEQNSAAGTKGAVGTIGGAAVGGLLFGGAGAIVGGMASGNKVVKFSNQKFAVLFDDENWIIVEMDTNEDTIIGRIGKAEMVLLNKRFAVKVISPFAA